MKETSYQIHVSIEPDGQVLESPKERLFFDDTTAQFTDLSGVCTLRYGVDTVRQLYDGELRPGVMALSDLSVNMVKFADYEWSKDHIGCNSSYQYRLQNTEMGLVLLIRDHSIEVDTLGSHLKIEVSPHTLDGTGPRILQGVLDDLATTVLSHCEASQTTVHIALDVQGWKSPRDLVDRMHCRSRRVRQISRIGRIEFDDNASVYGYGETYMFGSANGLQLSIYNKTLQTRVTDKLDYWESMWATLNGDPFGDGNPACNPLETVQRLEFRFYHSIVQQFSEGSRMASGEVIGCRTCRRLCPHLQGLWSYTCESSKLLNRTAVYDPFWGLISQNTRIQIECDLLIERAEYRRYYRTAKGFSGRNCKMFLGQFVNLIARERVPAEKAIESARKLEFQHVIEDHYLTKSWTRRDLERHIRKLMCDRYLRRGHAVQCRSSSSPVAVDSSMQNRSRANTFASGSRPERGRSNSKSLRVRSVLKTPAERSSQRTVGVSPSRLNSDMSCIARP